MLKDSIKVISRKEFVKIIKQTVKEFFAKAENNGVVNVVKSNKPSWCICAYGQCDGQLTIGYNYKEFVNIYKDLTCFEQRQKAKDLTVKQLNNSYCFFRLFDKTPLTSPITFLRAC